MSGITTQQLLLATSLIPVSITYTDSVVNTSALTTYTFSNRSIGTAASDRIVIVGVVGRDIGTTANINSVTVGGVSMTGIASAKTAITNNSLTGILAVPFASGTTADIVVTFSEAVVRCAIGVWSMVGKSSVTAYDTAALTTNTDPATVSIDIPAGGAAVSIAVEGSGNSNTATWAGLSENFDTDFATNRVSGASGNFTTMQTNLTVGPDWSGATVETATCAASWGN